MKLYATTTSERASKGQGGNKYVETILKDERQNPIALMLAEIRENEIYIEFCHLEGGAKHIYSSELVSKGKQKKDEKHYGQHIEGNEYYCLDCQEWADKQLK